MLYRLRREIEQEKVIGLSLGVSEVDAYLRFWKCRCRPHPWINYGYDLQVFLNTMRKPLLEVTAVT
jgi:hypothetical protein